MSARDSITEAMRVLENLPAGGVGEDGPTRDELIVMAGRGQCYADDATVATCQEAWRLLENALSKLSL